MKFQYGQKVIVTNGFYKGLTGFVTEYKKSNTEDNWSKYYIEMEGLRGTRWCTPSNWILENDLRIYE